MRQNYYKKMNTVETLVTINENTQINITNLFKISENALSCYFNSKLATCATKRITKNILKELDITTSDIKILDTKIIGESVILLMKNKDGYLIDDFFCNWHLFYYGIPDEIRAKFNFNYLEKHALKVKLVYVFFVLKYFNSFSHVK